MKEISPYEKCTGCTACTNICPKSCIRMEPDQYGFLRPVINTESCVDCGLCVKVCPNNGIIGKNYPQVAYAAWSLDAKDRETSTSGGVSSVLSSFVVNNGGVVYGAAFQNGCVEHIRVSQPQELYKLKGSKYVQSNLNNVYTLVSRDLLEGRRVLFWGTPCQTMGLKSFIINKRIKALDNIIYGDIICHGVPSQKILNNHIKSVIGAKGKGPYSLSFRDEDGYFLTIRHNDKLLYRKGFPQDKYLNGFQYGLFHRECCFECQYASGERISDITIGDFWGLGETTYPKKKVSVVLCNTAKGVKLIDAVSDKLFLEGRPIQEAIQGNSQLQHPSRKHEYYNLFHWAYPKFGYRVAVNYSLLKFYLKHFIFRTLYRNRKFKIWYNKRRA